MNKLTAKTIKSRFLRIVPILVSVTVTAFFVGGGWKFFSSEEQYGLWHSTRSDWEFFAACENMFAGWGIAQALTALAWTMLVIRLYPVWRHYLWLWAFLLTSIVFGGYKFFLAPGEYFIAPLAGKKIHSLIEVIFLPFIVNGGAVGLSAAITVGIIQVVGKRKASPSQGL